MCIKELKLAYYLVIKQLTRMREKAVDLLVLAQSLADQENNPFYNKHVLAEQTRDAEDDIDLLRAKIMLLIAVMKKLEILLAPLRHGGIFAGIDKAIVPEVSFVLPSVRSKL